MCLKTKLDDDEPKPPLHIGEAMTCWTYLTMLEEEIANALSFKMVANYMMCASGAVQSVRNDVGMMFVKFQAEKLKFGSSLKTLMRKRGWIKVPQYYVPNGLPTQ
jgi:hypothetical protein